MDNTAPEYPSPFTYEALATHFLSEAAALKRTLDEWAGNGTAAPAHTQLRIDKMLAAALHFERLSAPVVYATSAQKQEITRLCNHPLITRGEKTKISVTLHQLAGEQATEQIAQLRATIELREGMSQQAA